MSKILVMSIKPKYAEMIYSGTKLFEFRKAPPRNLNASYLIYESAPVSSLTGMVNFSASLTVRSHAMVTLIRNLLGVTKTRAIEMMGITEKELIEYAGGPNKFVTALMIETPFRSPGLSRYKIRPPQNWGQIQMEIPPAVKED